MTDGRHHNIRRLALIFDALAARPDIGLRLVDLVEATDLQKGTLHRLMGGLVENGLAVHDRISGRYLVGPRVMGWAGSGRRRYGLIEQLQPALQAICERTGDTVYLTIRNGDSAFYVDRHVGSYPLKALPVDVGAQRPLGIGAAPLAILAFQSDIEIERIIQHYRKERMTFGIKNDQLRRLITLARRLGYALHDGEILPGMVAIGVPYAPNDRAPIAAVSVAASAERLTGHRRGEIARIVAAELSKA